MRKLKSIALAVALAVAAPAGLTLVAATPAAAQADDFTQGVNAFNAGKYDEAVAAYTRATKSQPGNALAWAYLGDALTRANRAEESEPAYRKALSIDSNCGPCNAGLGTFLFNNKRDAEALPYYEKAVRLTPSDAQLSAYLGDTYLRLDRYDDGLDSYNAALAIDGSQLDALRGVVLAWLLKEDKDKAKGALENLRRVDAEAAASLEDLFQ
jgi:tetratricopeptide (TPR) repeat protein